MCKAIGRGWKSRSRGTALKFCFLVVQLVLQSSVLRGAETQPAAVSTQAALRTVRRNWTPVTASMCDYQSLFVKCNSHQKIISVSNLSQVHIFGQVQSSPRTPAAREPGKCSFILTRTCNSAGSNRYQVLIDNFSNIGINLSDYKHTAVTTFWVP